ncbi:SPFH domain-containing protein [Sciscionella marina]|uniref:SPFH domain-containing protein n=1 Tax=Sciscionella marina TaxID=508770 RepID=UPI00146E9920|nr:SPFH domain-containing protein [Sciscionella marina]
MLATVAQPIARAPGSELEFTTLGWSVNAMIVLTGLIMTFVRRVPAGAWLVVLHAGRVVTVRGGGFAIVVPWRHHAVSVPARPEWLEVWVIARTRDSVSVRLHCTAQVVVVDPGAFAGHGATVVQAETEIDSAVRAEVAEHRLASLLRSGGGGFPDLTDRLRARTNAFGVELTERVCVNVEALLENGEHERGGGHAMDIAMAGVPGTGTLHYGTTRDGQRFGLLVEREGDLRFFVYRQDSDLPAQTIVLDKDEAAQLADLLHDRSIADRLAALERCWQRMCDETERET